MADSKLTSQEKKSSIKAYDKVLSDRAIKRAAKLSIKDQIIISKQATKLRAQTETR